jgi:hypothetical protein
MRRRYGNTCGEHRRQRHRLYMERRYRNFFQPIISYFNVYAINKQRKCDVDINDERPRWRRPLHGGYQHGGDNGKSCTVCDLCIWRRHILQQHYTNRSWRWWRHYIFPGYYVGGYSNDPWRKSTNDNIFGNLLLQVGNGAGLLGNRRQRNGNDQHGCYGKCGRSAECMCRRHGNPCRQHRRQRHQFYMERGERYFLKSFFTDVYLYSEHWQRRGNIDTDNKRS